MAIFEYDTPRTIQACKRLIRTLRQQYALHRIVFDDSWIEARLVARLRGAGFALTDIGPGRILVTQGTVDVDGIWRRSRAASRWLAERDHAFLTQQASERMTRITAREDEERRASERLKALAEMVDQDAELEHVSL